MNKLIPSIVTLLLSVVLLASLLYCAVFTEVKFPLILTLVPVIGIVVSFLLFLLAVSNDTPVADTISVPCNMCAGIGYQHDYDNHDANIVCPKCLGAGWVKLP